MNFCHQVVTFNTSATTGSSPSGLSVVSNGRGWEWVHSPSLLRTFPQRETEGLKQFVSKMTWEGAIEKCKFLWFQGRLFSVGKEDSSDRRVILDLSRLSQLGLHMLYRSYRGFLTCSGRQGVSQLPGVYSGTQELQIQGHAIRSGCSPRILTNWSG